MKRFLLLAIGLVFAFSASAQTNDWAKFGRYADANKSVTERPDAVFMGNSITEQWASQDPEFFTKNNFVGRGISGQTTAEMLVRFRQDVIALNPRVVVIMAGINDIALNNGFIELDNIFGNIVSMCEIAKANKIRPVICSVLPVKRYGWRPEVTDSAEKIIRLNSMLKEYAAENKLKYVDYHSAMKDEENGLPAKWSYDGVHLNADGYEVIEEIILKVLK